MHSGYPEKVKLEKTLCPNGCPDNDELVLVGRDRIHNVLGDFNIVKCKSCGLQRTNPRPTAGTIGVYYPDNYAPYLVVDKSPLIKRGAVKKIIISLLGLDARKIPPIAPGEMLELGCASGSFMEEMGNQGWHVQGIEFSDSAAEVARKKGFTVQTSSLENAQKPNQFLDVIVAWMVLEHLHAPVQVLSRLRYWIKPDGYLVASVPDANSLAKKFFKARCYDLHLPNHLYHYTPKTLEVILNNSGWKLERVVWQKNCMTLLSSAEYWAKDFNHIRMLRLIQWLKSSPSAAYIRLVLGWILGVTRQSGRIEIWARPK